MIRMRRGCRAAVTLIAAGMIAAGCGGQKTTSPETNGDTAAKPVDAGAATKKPRVALIMKSLANEFFLTMENGAKAHQREHADEYELICNGIKDELDVAKQVSLVEQMVAQGVDAIVLSPADSKALVAAAAKALAAGVVVVNIDNKLDDGVQQEKGVDIPFVGPDNRKGAKMVADYLAKRLAPGDPVAIIEGVPTAYNAIQRKLGFEDSMKEAGCVVVTSQSAGWEMSKANTLVSAIITEHPQLKAILCSNDSMALGAVSALKAAGRMQDVLVAGFDNIAAAQELVRNGTLVATADQHADLQAVYGIEYALEILKTGATPQDRETDVDLITAETL